MIVVVIPTYNEASNIKQLLSSLKKHKVIIIDDNSPDGTGEIAASFSNVDLIERPRKLGLASAYLDGFKYAIDTYNPEIIIQMDAGLTHNPSDIKRLIEKLTKTNSDLVIGSRFNQKVEFKGLRTVISKTAAFLMRLLGIKANDVTSGFRCWKTTALKSVLDNKILSKHFGIQFELLYYATKSGLKIETIDIDYKLSNTTLNLKILLDSLFTYLRLILSCLKT